MSVPSGYSMRPATVDDLPAIVRLRESVGWPIHEWALHAVLEPPARCLVVTRRGRVVAVGSGMPYGALGFVGNMIVDERHRGNGLGSSVLEAVATFLEGAGCTRLELMATDDGQRLYRRHGFALEAPSTVVRVPHDTVLGDAAGTVVEPATPEHLELLVAYDRPRFGGDRTPLIGRMLADPARPVVMARRSGAIVGWGWLRPDVGRIGPFVADEPRTAAAILAAGLAAAPDDPITLYLPGPNRAGLAWLRAIGAHLTPWEGRMARGPRIERREETIYGAAVGALG